MIAGSGEFQYRIKADWAILPEGWSFKGSGWVGVDSNDNVYFFNRGEHPMIVFDLDGNLLLLGRRLGTGGRTALTWRAGRDDVPDQ